MMGVYQLNNIPRTLKYTIIFMCEEYQLNLIYHISEAELRDRMVQDYLKEMSPYRYKESLKRTKIIRKIIESYLKLHLQYRDVCLLEVKRIYEKYGATFPSLTGVSFLSRNKVLKEELAILRKYSDIISNILQDEFHKRLSL